MFPFILEDMSLVSQIYTMIQQFCPNRWIMVSPAKSPVFIEFRAYCLDRSTVLNSPASAFSLYLSNLASIRFDHFCLKEENVAVMAS